MDCSITLPSKRRTSIRKASVSPEAVGSSAFLKILEGCLGVDLDVQLDGDHTWLRIARLEATSSAYYPGRQNWTDQARYRSIKRSA